MWQKKIKNCEACRAPWDSKVLLKFLFGMLMTGSFLSYSGLLTVLVSKGEHSKACSEAYLSFFFLSYFSFQSFFLLSKWKPTFLAECFMESAFLESKMRQQLCLLEQVATSPCWMEAHLVTSGAGSKTSAKEAAWLGAVHPSEWAGDTISLGFFEERAVLQPSSMNWSFRKPRPEFERIWANRWVLVKTKSDFDPKPAKLSDFEHLSRIQWSQEVRDGEDTETQCWCISLI